MSALSSLRSVATERKRVASWTSKVPQCDCPQKFQNLVISLCNFSREFRSGKYAEVFLVMADPLDAFLALLLARSVPHDVMVSTLSGSIRTLQNQLIGRKKGRRDIIRFTRHTQQVSVALTAFVNALQSAIRQHAVLAQQAGEEGIASPVHRPSRALVKTESPTTLRNMIRELRDPPIAPNCPAICQHALSEYPHFSIIGLLLLCVAISTLLCSSWYRVSGDITVDWLTYLAPFLEIIIGVGCLTTGFWKSSNNMHKLTQGKWSGVTERHARKAEDERGWSSSHISISFMDEHERAASFGASERSESKSLLIRYDTADKLNTDATDAAAAAAVTISV